MMLMRKTMYALGIATMLYTAAPVLADQVCDWKRTSNSIEGTLDGKWLKLTPTKGGEQLYAQTSFGSVSFTNSSNGLIKVESCYSGKEMRCDTFIGKEVPESAQEAFDTYVGMINDSREMCLKAHFREELQ